MSSGITDRLFNVKPGERTRTILAGLFFFFILFGYFLLRPARESLGVQSGIDVVRYLYVGTLLLTAAANPLFSLMVSRLPRRIFIPLTYRVFMLNIIIFFLLFLLLRDSQGQPTEARLWVSRVYYVWITVFALFNTMVFWAVMAESFTLAQSKRLYPIIAIGGTLGALAGSTYAWQLAELLGTAWLVLSSVVFFELGVQCYKRLARHAANQPDPANPTPSTSAQARDDRVIGGGILGGLFRTLRSPYLLAISAYIMILTICSTFLYFTELRIVSGMTDHTDTRTGLFASVNLWTQAATLLVQLFVTAQLLRRLGTGVTLMILPALTAAGFLALATAPSFALIVLAQAGYRAGKYAIARPARETLFTVVDAEDRYKSKAFVDTFVYRTGDVVGAVGESAAEKLATPADAVAAKLAGTLIAVAGIAVPLCVLWGGLGWYLGKKQTILGEGSTADPTRKNGRAATADAPAR